MILLFFHKWNDDNLIEYLPLYLLHIHIHFYIYIHTYMRKRVAEKTFIHDIYFYFPSNVGKEGIEYGMVMSIASWSFRC